MSSIDDCSPSFQYIVTTPSLDDCLTIIADRRRRKLIDHLRNNGNGRARIDDVVNRLDREKLAAPRPGRPPDREALAMELHHNHLPKLEDYGVVDYDLERGMIQYLPNDQLEAALDSLPKAMSQPNP